MNNSVRLHPLRESGHTSMLVKDQSSEWELDLDPIDGRAYLAPLDVVIDLPLSNLGVLRRQGQTVPLLISTLPSEHWDPKYAEPWLKLQRDTRGRILGSFVVWTDKPQDPFDEDAPRLMEGAISALVASYGAAVRRVEFDPTLAAVPPWPFSIDLSLPTRERTVEHIAGLALTVDWLMAMRDGGHVDRDGVIALVRSGLAASLVGQPESVFLDVKRQHYDFTTDAGKIGLAQDAARFANAETGGVIAVGMSGRRVEGGEVISGLTPVAATGRDARRYQQIIEHRVFPLIDGLEVFSVDVENGQLLIVHIPPQPEDFKPFLVHGAIVGRGVEGAFISIVRRRGEHSVPITAAGIHALLAAGRALMRRGQLPPD